jgi:hypothetical protein
VRDYIELKRNFVPVAADTEPNLAIGVLVAAEIKGNAAGEIAVTVIGIDAVKRVRGRARGHRKKAPVVKKSKSKFLKLPAKSTKRASEDLIRRLPNPGYAASTSSA